MRWASLPTFNQEAVKLAEEFPLDWVQIEIWSRIMRETGFDDAMPFAMVDLQYGLFAFQAGKLRVTALQKGNEADVAHLVLIEKANALRGDSARTQLGRRAVEAFGLVPGIVTLC